jgi:hypothetical protein
MSCLRVQEKPQLTPAFAELSEKPALTGCKEKKASGGLAFLDVESDT